MNILVFSNAISPYHGSEFAVGWNYVKYMSKRHKLYVLYGGNKEYIEKYTETSKLENVTFIYAGNHQSSINWTKYPYLSRIRVIIAHKIWHKRVFNMACELLKKYNIDIIHFLNPIGFKEPGYLWLLDKPYIWGPIQGVENYPLCLYSTLSIKGLIEGLTRFCILNYKFFFDRRVVKSIKRADLLLSATPKTQHDLLRYHKKKSFYIPENAIENIETTLPIKYIKGECLNIISVGNLCDRKGFILQLKTVKRLLQLGYTNFKWVIVGSGYNENLLKRYVNKHSLSGNIIFTGQINRNEVQSFFRMSHLNIISSLSEATTTVLWESMSKGIPTMTLDHCGMSGVLSDNDSFKIKVRRASKVISDMSNVISNILNNPSIIEEKSRNTILLATKYTWEQRVDTIDNLYLTAIRNHINKKEKQNE